MNAALLLLVLMVGSSGQRAGWSSASIGAPVSTAGAAGPGSAATVSGPGTTVAVTLATDALSSPSITTEATVR